MIHEFPVDWFLVKPGDTIYVSKEAFADYCGDAELIMTDISL